MVFLLRVGACVLVAMALLLLLISQGGGWVAPFVLGGVLCHFLANLVGGKP